VPIAFQIPAALREFTDGRSAVEVSISKGTVSDAFAALWLLYPGVRDRIINEQGQVRQHINVFVGSEHIRYTGGLATPLCDGVVISIVPAVSGGSK
jgi:molybdopterin synthase sulfur carrier subunit